MTTPDEGQPAVPVSAHVPLDLVIELVESRIRQRRKASFQWAVGIAVGLISVTLGGVALVVNNADGNFRPASTMRNRNFRAASMNASWKTPERGSPIASATSAPWSPSEAHL